MKSITVIKPRKFLEAFFHKFKDDGTTDLAAQLAYYFLLSIFPLLLFILTLLPYFSLETDAVVTFIQNRAPGETGEMIADNVSSILRNPRAGLLSIGLIATLWTASNGISALMRSINKAYNVKETRSFFKVKFRAVALTVAMVFVIAVTLVLPVFGQLIFDSMQSFFHIPADLTFVFQALRWLISFAIMVFVLMMLYRLAPNAAFPVGEVFWGSIFAAVAWQLISLGFSFYVTNFGNYEATYGALGGIIILMVWFYLTGLILIVGGQINAVLHQLKQN